MKHKIFPILLASLLSGCATGGGLCHHYQGAVCIPAPHETFINNPAASHAYLVRVVPAETLKRWERAIPDETAVFQFDPESGTGTVR